MSHQGRTAGIAGAVIAVAALTFTVTACGRSTPEAHEREHRESSSDRVTIAPDMAAASGIEVAPVGPGTLREIIELYGSIQPDAERLRNVTARYPGVIRSVARKIGDRVRAGETLATVESNESLQTYAVAAPIAGVVTQRNANPGELAGEAPLFVVADFATVWAELAVFPRDHARLKPGMEVAITATDGQSQGQGRIGYVSPVSAGGQSLIARVVLDNARGQWTPGVFVDARVTVGETLVPLAIPRAAIQSLGGRQVVFVNTGAVYDARPLELGRSDGELVEVVSGLQAGERIAVAGSFVIKAEIEKSGAAHEH